MAKITETQRKVLRWATLNEPVAHMPGVYNNKRSRYRIFKKLVKRGYIEWYKVWIPYLTEKGKKAIR